MENSNLAMAAARDAGGRFLPGRSGNPAGKKPGTRNRATEIRAMLAEGEEMAVARTVIDKATSGDAVAARFLLGLLCPRPRPRGRAIALALPDGARAGDTVAAFNATLQAMAAGEITPDEAVTVTRMLDGRLEALNAFKLQRELTRYRGDFIRGDELFRPAEEQFREPGVVAAEEEVEEETAEKETEAATLTEPSPPGRGQGEGGCRASVVEDERVVGDPHPALSRRERGWRRRRRRPLRRQNPLPPGEGRVRAAAAPPSSRMSASSATLTLTLSRRERGLQRARRGLSLPCRNRPTPTCIPPASSWTCRPSRRRGRRRSGSSRSGAT
jgi:hypothetical protein